MVSNFAKKKHNTNFFLFDGILYLPWERSSSISTEGSTALPFPLFRVVWGVLPPPCLPKSFNSSRLISLVRSLAMCLLHLSNSNSNSHTFRHEILFSYSKSLNWDCTALRVCKKTSCKNILILVQNKSINHSDLIPHILTLAISWTIISSIIFGSWSRWRVNCNGQQSGK